MVSKKVTGRALSMGTGIALGVLLCGLVTLAGCLMGAYLICTEAVAKDGAGYLSMIILFASSLLGAWLSSAKTKRLRIQTCLLTGLGYFALLLLVTALFFGGQYTGMGVTALLVLLGSGCAAVLSSVHKTGNKIKLKKGAYR